jgi:acyl dehydratase
MTQQRYDEDVEVGAELPSLTRTQSLKAFVRYAWGSNDLAEGHYDHKRAMTSDLGEVFAQGALTAGYIGQMLSDWYTPDGFMKKFSVQYRQPTIPGDVLTTGGVVTRKYQENGEHLVECDVWAENQEGRKVTVAQAIVSLPSRQS